MSSFLKLFFIVTFFNILLGCSSNDDNESYSPTLPPVTESGENTFGCFIDGKLLVPRDKREFGGKTLKGMSMIEYSSTNSTIESFCLRIIDFKSNVGDLAFYFYNLHQLGEGSYTIKRGGLWQNDSDVKAISLWVKTPENVVDKLYYSIEDGGILTITKYDYSKGIISGTFSCKLINNYNESEIGEITQGRFDINIKTLNDTNFK